VLPQPLDSGRMDLVGQVIDGRYRVLRKLGGGGMGTVYLAEHVRLGRPTALKVLRADLSRDAQAEERFRREAMLAAKIDCPTVARVFDFDRTPSGEFLLAMEYVEGETVATRLDREGPFSIPLAIHILLAVADGLERAHQLGIIHRDLKPENVMLAAQGAVKLLDFGVARDLGSSGSTSGGLVVGTPTYMSPEQLMGEPVAASSDIYSLGVVFYEMVSGRLPHSGETFVEIRANRLMHPPPPLDALRSSCPPVLAKVVARALDPEPAGRWPSASAFARAAAEAAADPMATVPTPIPPPARHDTGQIDRWEAHFEALRFAGRDREMRIVRDAWAVARAGRTMVLWIEGEEGAGKSAFFELARREAAADGGAELLGRGYSGDVDRPYGAWIPMLRRALTLRAAAEQEWPAVVALTDADVETPVPERGQLFDAVSLLLRAAAERGALLVGMEDLHVCDAGSAALFEFLTHDMASLPILLAVTADPARGVGGARTRELRERLRRASHVSSLRLRPLGYEAVAGWLNRALGEEAPEPLVRFVYGHTEGNAFFIEQVVRSLVERGNLDRLSDEDVRVTLATMPPPEAVADVVRRRLREMSPAAREVLQIAAVVGREFDVDLVLELSRREEDAVLDALDQAVAAGVLVPVQGPGSETYRFTHGKIAEVHAQAMNPRRRRRLHAATGEALTTRPASPPGAIAWHWYHAGDRERSCEYACRAAQHALAVHDADDALTYGALAAEVASSDAEKRRAHELRGDALRRLYRHGEAAAAYAHARLVGGPPAALVSLRCKELRCALVGGDVTGAAAAEEARSLDVAAREMPLAIQASVAVALAEVLLAANEVPAAQETAGRAQTLAIEAHLDYEAAEALLVLGHARLRSDDFAGAREAAKAAAVGFAALHDAFGAAQAGVLVGMIEAAAGRRDAALAAFNTARGEAEQANLTRLVRAIDDRITRLAEEQGKP